MYIWKKKQFDCWDSKQKNFCEILC